MAGNNKFQKDKLTRKVDMLARMEANDASREEKLLKIFGVDIHTATDREINRCDVNMSRWRKHPAFDTAWKDEARKWDYEDYALARKVFRQGMRQDNDKWLAMNSAVNAINNAGKRLFHDEDSAVTVKIEGMPDLGTPDQDE
jgi:hypothetical protein